MIFSVCWARLSTDVKATSNLMPLRSRPARWASSSPSLVMSTSTHPVKRFSRFHCDCPWRTRTSLPISDLLLSGEHLGDCLAELRQRDGLGQEAGPLGVRDLG